MSAFSPLLRADLWRVARERWYVAVVAAGCVIAMVVVAISAGQSGQAAIDGLRADGASVLGIGGLVVAIGLGATAFWRDIGSGALGLLAAAGAPRGTIASSRAASRVLLLLAAIALWTLLISLGTAVLGRGVDTEFMVHGAAQFLTFATVLLAAAAMSTVLGPWVAGTFGVIVAITTQATVNLAAAAEAGLLGTAERLVRVSYNMLPHSIVSPMIAEMQNNDVGGPAAPQFEINNIPVPASASSLGSILWTCAWCLFILWVCFIGLRQRNLA